jgi:hypothetical protein
LTLVVVCAAALFVQSVTIAAAAGPGFDADRTIFATVKTRHTISRDLPRIQARIARDAVAGDDVVQRIAAMAGVEAVAIGPPPLGHAPEQSLIRRPRTGPPEPSVGWLPVGPGYLDALGVPLLAGREGIRDEVVIAPGLARQRFGDDSPLGELLQFGQISYPVVGIADFAFGSIRLGRAPFALFFGGMTAAGTITRSSTGDLSLTIRATRPESLRAPLERLLSQAFPEAPVVEVTTGRDLVAADLGRERLSAWLFTGFGIVFLALAIEGVFGLVASLVATRRREFAVRIALGATRSDIARRALRGGLEPVAAGAAFGLIAAAIVSRAIQSYLLGVNPVEPLTYATVFAGILASAALAAAVGTRRVRHVSPIETLRTDS